MYEILKNDNRLNSVVVFDPHTEGHCFQIKFSIPIGIVHRIYISYPMDIYENKQEYPTPIETTLIDAEDNLCYVE